MKNSPDLQPAAPYNAADYCSTKEAAAVLGVSHRTVQLWVENGTLQAWRTAGGHRRITLESVNRLVEGRRIAIAAHAPPPAAPTASASSTRRVLVVDDDPLMLRLYELEMAGWGMDLDVVKANNGFEALIRIGEPPRAGR